MSRCSLRFPRHHRAVPPDPGLDPAAGRVAPYGEHGLGHALGQAHGTPAGGTGQRYRQGLDLEVGLAAEGAADVGHRHPHVGHRHPEHLGDLGADEERVGGGRPQGDLVTLEPGHRGVGLKGVVADHRELEGVLEDRVRLLERRRDVAGLEPLVVADVPRQLLLQGGQLVVFAGQGVGIVQHRGVRRQRLVHGGRQRKLLVAHAHQGQRLLGDVAGLGRHRHHRLADVAHPVRGDERPVPQAVPVVGIDVLDGLPGENAMHPGERLGVAHVDAVDQRVGKRAPEHPPLQQPGKVQVTREPRLPGDLLHPFRAADGSADGGELRHVSGRTTS